MSQIVEPDFSEELPQITAGHYLCKVVQAELKVGKEKGTRYVSWKLEMLPHHWTIYHNTAIEGRAAGMFKHMIHSAGDKGYEKGPYDIQKVVGKYIQAKLDFEEGQSRNGATKQFLKVQDIWTPTQQELDEQWQKQKQTIIADEDIPF